MYQWVDRLPLGMAATVWNKKLCVSFSRGARYGKESTGGGLFGSLFTPAGYVKPVRVIPTREAKPERFR